MDRYRKTVTLPSGRTLTLRRPTLREERDIAATMPMSLKRLGVSIATRVERRQDLDPAQIDEILDWQRTARIRAVCVCVAEPKLDPAELEDWEGIEFLALERAIQQHAKETEEEVERFFPKAGSEGPKDSPPSSTSSAESSDGVRVN